MNFAQRLTALTPQQRSLLERRLKQKGLSTLSAPSIPKRLSDQDIPLSFAQQRLWFLNQLEPTNPFYNIPMGLCFSGNLDEQSLERSFNAVVARHEGLRTHFAVTDGKPHQVIVPHLTLAMPVVDLQAIPADQQPSEVERLAIAEMRRPFNLATGPLLRLTLLRLQATERVLLATIHHTVADGWSRGVLLRELASFYQAFVSGSTPQLPELSIQYADFAIWQRQWLQGPELAAQLDYWRQQLQDLPTLQLPSDRPRPVSQTYRGAKEWRILPSPLTEGVKALSQQEGVTVFMLLLAAFKTLLYRYTGQKDLVVGAPVANRNRSETEGLIGFFVNALVLRTQLDGNLSFRQALQRVKTVASGAFAHQDLPFEKIVEDLQPERSLSHNPLFQVVFQFQDATFQLQNTLQPIEYLPGLHLSRLPLDQQITLFDLSFELGELAEGLAVLVEYSTDLYDASTIVRLMDHFEVLLAGILADPDQSLSELPLLPESELHQLHQWNAAIFDASETPSELLGASANVVQQFEAQVEQRPEALAAAEGDRSLTYRQLNQKANQLARYLQRLGIKPEIPVGICLERSLEMLVSILGVLKAGGAYLPMDPAYPTERLAYMLTDAEVPVLLTQERLSQQFADADLAQVVCLDRDWDALIQSQVPASDNLSQQLDPQNLAYVIYTSGSTGRPKGVAVQHAGLNNLVNWHQRVYQTTPADRAAQLAGPGFDASVWEIFPYLTAGASLHLPDETTRLSPPLLRDWLTSQAITLAFLPTPLAEALLAEPHLADWSLRSLLVGGDTLHHSPPAGLTCPLVNHYGPTENTVVTTWMEIAPSRDERTPPIGRPIDRAQVYVLDERLQPVPIGIPGELFVAGSSLARGYLHRPEATAARFIPNPFSHEPGQRLYRTGDRVRYRADGNLEFLGRIDFQVKLRGFRIELGEIEAVLTQHPAVREALALVREDGLIGKELVAYVIPHQTPADAAAQADHVSLWQGLYDETYSQEIPTDDRTFNIIGWNSSYTGLPLPTAAMREWVDQTVTQIRALQPDRVLEIGCGTGLLLFEIAPQTSDYWGIDFSAVALDSIRQQLTQPGNELPQVHLDQRLANQFEAIPTAHFDTVIINSVAQYFPSAEYLLEVLEGAVQTVQPGGSLFIGDIRSLPLLEAFHTSVELHQAAADLPTAQLRQRIQMAMAQEQELVIAPAFFLALRQRLPRITHVQIQPKQGHHQNELTQFRYDVTIYLDTPVETPPSFPWLNGAELARDRWRQQIAETQLPILGVREVPNGRLTTAVEALARLQEADVPATAGDVRQARPSQTGIDPTDWEALAEKLGYAVAFSWASGATDGRYDVVLHRLSAASQAPSLQRWFPLPQPPVQSWSTYANHPLQTQATRDWMPQLRGYLQERLPDYMTPTHLVPLDSLPLTPNGKVDRCALPAPELTQLDRGSAFTLPRTATEEILVGIWSQTLGIAQLSIHDNFFELGGHSLLATQVTSRLRDALGVELSVRCLFEAPTIAQLATQIEAQRSPSSQPAVDSQTIQPCGQDKSLPLSFAQQRLWFLDRLQPGNFSYNVPAAVRLAGSLNVAALLQSCNVIVRRHAALRTNFVLVEGSPVQVIASERNLALPLVDLQNLPEATRSRQVQQLASQEAQTPFDLSSDPLLRLTLLRLSATEHVLLFTMHHIISDGWSIGVLLRELTALYEGFTRRQTPDLPDLPIQYADFAVWQRQWLQGDTLNRQLAYWRQQLAGEPPLLDLPSDRPRQAVQRFRGADALFTLPPAVTAHLKALSQRQGVTLFMTLLAVFKALLYRYTGQEDIWIGSPIANRNRAEIEGLIGFFVNTLVFRTDVSQNPTFIELLRRVREVSLAAYAHQDLPFEKLVEALQPRRDLSHTPLVQVMFALQNAPTPPPQLDGVTVELMSDVYRGTAKFDLTLSMADTETGLRGILEYNTDQFDARTINRLVDHFQTLLAEVGTNPQQHLSDLPLMPPAEQHQMLMEWNQTRTETPIEQCVHHLFEAQVRRSPDAVAVRFAHQRITYQELNYRADRLAQTLRSLGVGPEILVGVCIERSIEMMVGLLAILKAGGAYVPLDPNYPQERLAWVLEDAQVTVLLTQAHLLPHLPSTTATQVCLNAAGEWGIDRHPGTQIIASEKSENKVFPDHLAYVIYTSGSTGKPKGVQISHTALVNVLASMGQQPGLCSEDILLAVTTLSFDIAALELFLPLLAGAQLVIASRETAANGVKLAQCLQQSGATVMQATPATWQMLLTAGWSGNPALKVFCGGEAPPPSLAHPLSTCCASLWNLYGPTEATIWSAATQVEPDGDTVPIGLPIANTQFYVLDAHQQVVPVGVPGELHIGGRGLARGYLNRAELTAEKFIPNPFAQQPGERLYKTGDLVRYRTDGTLAFIGRLDHQVKLRGFRIELGEIEAALQSHTQVQQAVVQVAQERLVAYVAPVALGPDEEAQPLANSLRTYLQRCLPAYMIPSIFVSLESLPLTPNGKIDRQALPPPPDTRPELAAAYVQPGSEIEQAIATVWRQVLGIQQVGIHDNFFELGGYSLLLVQAHVQLQTRFPFVALLDLFRYPTIESLASYLSQASSRSAQAGQKAAGDRAAQLQAGKTRLRQRRQKRTLAQEK